jgi:murein DD-endopeptidase MepM/ murein hydrolase activator NlpD
VPTTTGEHFFAQRYAANLVMRNIRTQQPAPIGASTKEQHYAWNRKVISASAGTVVAAEDDNADMELGIEDLAHPLGNFVVIRHPDGVFLMYGHLRNGSVQVQVGDVVEVGQNVGRVGSSGQTDIPTLHFQVSDAWEGPDDVSRLLYSQGLPMLIEGINLVKERGLVPLNGVQMMDKDIVESRLMESIR